jgi:hypothetical protein
MNDPRPPKPKPRWYQFRLRTLLALTLLVGVGLSWFAAKMHRARKQREAVIALVAMGATIEYEEGAGKELWNRLLATLVGKESMPVYCVWLPPGATEPGLDHVEQLSGLKCLYAAEAHVTDVDLEHLERLDGLEYLMLDGTQVSDQGLGHLKCLAKLKTLGVQGTNVTDKGVKELQHALPDCRIHHTTEGVNKLWPTCPDLDLLH